MLGVFMLVDLNNLKISLECEVQKQLKSKSVPEILGWRVVKGPWDKTLIMDVETNDANLSALLLDLENGLQLAGPFKVNYKETKHESKISA